MNGVFYVTLYGVLVAFVNIFVNCLIFVCLLRTCRYEQHKSTLLSFNSSKALLQEQFFSFNTSTQNLSKADLSSSTYIQIDCLTSSLLSNDYNMIDNLCDNNEADQEEEDNSGTVMRFPSRDVIELDLRSVIFKNVSCHGSTKEYEMNDRLIKGL